MYHPIKPLFYVKDFRKHYAIAMLYVVYGTDGKSINYRCRSDTINAHRSITENTYKLTSWLEITTYYGDIFLFIENAQFPRTLFIC